MHEQLIQLTSNYFCCAVVAMNGVIIEAAPIVSYMIGWDANKFVSYCKDKKIDFINAGRHKKASDVNT